MLLLLDNYDSFTYNLYQYFCELGQSVSVIRNDKTTIREIEKLRPEYIVISPGPSAPLQAGISNDVIRRFGPQLPVLGICLGHQCIGFSCGGIIKKAAQIMHGKSSLIHHTGKGVYTGLPNPFSAVRYHSLVVEKETLPDCLEITAWTDDGTILGLRHRKYPVEGVQFHPESFITAQGKSILKNFLNRRVNCD
jgi:anthranilate synthase component 2